MVASVSRTRAKRLPSLKISMCPLLGVLSARPRERGDPEPRSLDSRFRANERSLETHASGLPPPAEGHQRARLRGAPMPWSLGERLLHPLGRKRHAADAHAGRIEDRVRDRRRHRPDRGFSRTGRRQLGMIDQHAVDRLRRLGDVEDRIGEPVHARYRLAIESDLFPQGARNALHDVALDAFDEAIRVDDLSAIMRDRELLREDLAALAVDFDLRHDRNAGAVALRIRDTAPGSLRAGLVAARRGPRLPAGPVTHRLEQRAIARILDVAQPK